MSKLTAFSKLTFLSLAMLSVDTHAGQPKQTVFGEELDKEIVRLQGFRSSTSGDLNASPACKRRFSKIFNKKHINISIGFGYGDVGAGEVANDWFIYNDFVAKLTQPCHPGISACGFRRDRKDPNILTRVVEAPTGENNYMMTLRITRPSLSWDGTRNTTVNAAKQLQVCQAARDKFLSEVASGADVAFYIGHSRDGGGPDFCPAKRKANSKVDYGYYQSKKEGINSLTNAMKNAVQAGKPNQLIGLFSCSSEVHFTNRLRAANPSAGLILTNRTVSFLHITLDAYSSLDSVLHQRCAEGFNEAFEYRQFGATLKNVF